MNARVWWAAGVLAVAGAGLGWAQKPGGGGGSSLPPPTPIPRLDPVLRDPKAPDYGPPPEHTPTFQDMQNKRYLEARLKQMVGESEKLLKLASDLNKKEPTADAVTRDDVHRVEEIEKLAHGVKWKMQLAVDGVKAQ